MPASNFISLRSLLASTCDLPYLQPALLQGTESSYGFARMLVSGRGRIDYTFVDMAGEVQDTFSIVKK